MKWRGGGRGRLGHGKAAPRSLVLLSIQVQSGPRLSLLLFPSMANAASSVLGTILSCIILYIYPVTKWYTTSEALWQAQSTTIDQHFCWNYSSWVLAISPQSTLCPYRFPIHKSNAGMIELLPINVTTKYTVLLRFIKLLLAWDSTMHPVLSLG